MSDFDSVSLVSLAESADSHQTVVPTLPILHQAAEVGDVKELDRIIVNKIQNINVTNYFNGTALSVASGNGKAAAVEYLSNAGADIEAVTDGGQTPLHIASQNGHVKCVQILLGYGAQIGTQI